MSRRNGSASRGADMSSGRLRMDRGPAHVRINDPSLPVGRRKEIDNVMKRARAGSPGTWDRKLLEVEEKDPNRWRHTGYKQLYLDGSITPSPPRGGSRVRSRSPRRRASPLRRMSPMRRVSPPRRASPSRRTSPLLTMAAAAVRARAPEVRRDALTSSSRRDTSPRPVVSSSRAPRRTSRDREREREKERDRERERERDRVKEREKGERGRRPPSPPQQPPRRGGRSPSGSSLSSCSDDSCSVCSAALKKKKPVSRSRSYSPPARAARPPRPAPVAPAPVKRPPLSGTSILQGASGPKQSRPILTKPLNSGNANAAPSSLGLRRTAAGGSSGAGAKRVKGLSPLRPTKELLEAREGKKRSREEKVLEWQQSQLQHTQQRLAAASVGTSPNKKTTDPKKDKPVEKLKMRIKQEGEKSSQHRRPNSGSASPPVSAEAIAAALAAKDSADDSSSSDDSAHTSQPSRLTLSDRFGKMAQWSADRSAAVSNMSMRITRRGDAGLTVLMDEVKEEREPERYDHEPAPAGHYPEELLAQAPVGLPSWDDVRVRYDYYKKRGYLRGLTLSDYVKWEEWWYKYQEWLKRERAYESWVAGGGGVGGERRRRGRRAARRGS